MQIEVVIVSPLFCVITKRYLFKKAGDSAVLCAECGIKKVITTAGQFLSVSTQIHMRNNCLMLVTLENTWRSFLCALNTDNFFVLYRYLLISEKLEEIKSFRDLMCLDLSCCKLGDEHELLEHLTKEALSRY